MIFTEKTQQFLGVKIHQTLNTKIFVVRVESKIVGVHILTIILLDFYS